MEIVVIAALIVAVPFILGGYLRFANRSLAHAATAWALVERHAHVLLEDRRLNPLVGDLVEALVRHAGDGRLTRSFLMTVLLRRPRRTDADMSTAIGSLNPDQEKQFLHLLVTVVFYDSLTTPIAGVALRRVVYWLAATAEDRSAPVSRGQVEPAMAAAGRTGTAP